MKTIERDSTIHQLMTDWRHDLHQHPETAFEEVRTAQKVTDILNGLPHLTVHTSIAKTGVVAVLTGNQGDNGKMIGLRADMDALDITEENDLPYASKTPGKMHACGHDGHTSMLLGAAKHLSANPDFAGRVAFIFQPAEEGAGGADTMCQEGLFERFPCDSVYGLHNWPGLPVGHFAIREGAIMASTDSFDITIQGKGTHAAMPELGIDPIIIASQLINALQTIVSRSLAATENGVVSVTKIEAGSAYNIIPDKVVLSGTVRTFSDSVRTTIHRLLKQQANAICQGLGATASVVFSDAYPTTVNDAEHTRICAQVASAMVGTKNVHLDVTPSMGAEDFSYMLQQKPGAYIWMGGGDGYGLHHPKYNFNDEALAVGANYWVALVKHLLADNH